MICFGNLERIPQNLRFRDYTTIKQYDIIALSIIMEAIMKLREFLIESRAGRGKTPEIDSRVQPSTDKDHDIVQMEYNYLSRRLNMVFGKPPCFTFPPIDMKDEKNAKPQLGERQAEALFKLVSIFWYVVFLHFEENPIHQKQLDKGIKIIYKTANRKFSNDDERQRSYLSYFNHAEKELADLYEFFRGQDNYYLSPQGVIDLPEYQIELIRRGDRLSEVKINMQKSIDLFESSANEEIKKNFSDNYDGYTERLKEACECEISENEMDLLLFLGDTITDRTVFDRKRLHDDFNVLDEEDCELIIEKIMAIGENDGFPTLNRYIQAKSKQEFDRRINAVCSSLAYTESDRAYNKYAKLHRLLGNLEKYDVSDEDLIKYEKHVAHLIKMLEKYAKAKQPILKDTICSDEEHNDLLNRIV